MAKYVEWDEPAYDQDGLVLIQTCRMLVSDVIKLQRVRHPGVYPETPYGDAAALNDFEAVHWSWFAEYDDRSQAHLCP